MRNRIIGLAAAAIVLSAIGAVALLALSGTGDKEPETLSIVPEQPDYLQRAVDLLSLLARDGAVNDFPLYYRTPEPGWVEQSAIAVDEWNKLGPPSSISRVHGALGRHMQSMVDAYREERFDAILTFKEPWNEWWNATEEYYGVQLLQGAGFMDPTFCPSDIVVVPPSDGTFDRWQLAAVARFPRPWETDGKVEPQELLRVVGLPGESILVGPDGVFINGQPVQGDVYAARQADYTFGPVTIPQGKYFLLADKRWKAIDSRNNREIGAPTFFGPDDLIGELPADAHGCIVNPPSPDE